MGLTSMRNNSCKVCSGSLNHKACNVPTQLRCSQHFCSVMSRVFFLSFCSTPWALEIVSLRYNRVSQNRTSCFIFVQLKLYSGLVGKHDIAFQLSFISLETCHEKNDSDDLNNRSSSGKCSDMNSNMATSCAARTQVWWLPGTMRHCRCLNSVVTRDDAHTWRCFKSIFVNQAKDMVKPDGYDIHTIAQQTVLRSVKAHK